LSSASGHYPCEHRALFGTIAPMRNPLPARIAAVLAAAVLSALLAASSAAAPARDRPLVTGIVDPVVFSGAQQQLAFRRTKAAGATTVRLALTWKEIAPRRPSGDRANPQNPGYSWAAFDVQVQNAVAAGLTPILGIATTPDWARDERSAGLQDTNWPLIDELASFAQAAAWRYSGLYDGLPHVGIWQVWNEPNARSHLRPQFRKGVPISPGHYRRMVNAVAGAVRFVDAKNLVVAGGLSPFGHYSADIRVVAPQRFMRQLLCLSRKLKATCGLRTSFDAWSVHPYTSGGPTHHAQARDDVSLGDLGEMRRILDAAVGARHVFANVPVEFWVTEFAWDSKPADPAGVPVALHARWVSEALYRMWKAGVSLVTWYRLRDEPLVSTPYQCGLWFGGRADLMADRPKPSLQAFRFPFVAFGGKSGASVWGRLPHGTPGTVAIERRGSSGWTRFATVQTDEDGIFQRRFAGPTTGPMRARLLTRTEASIAFSLRVPKDLRVNPFGCGGGVPCPSGTN
jgi:Cellulase (glycosyl hydrolase family 5)